MVFFPVVKQDTVKAIDGQGPGSSGLRQKVTVFREDRYLANIVRSTSDALPSKKVTGAALIPLGIENTGTLQYPFSSNPIEFVVLNVSLCRLTSISSNV